MSMHSPNEIEFQDSQKNIAIAQEFGSLISLKSLTDEQERRLNEILLLATQNEEVDFWISYTTYSKGKDLDYLTPESIIIYENQKSALREYCATEVAKNPNFGRSNITTQADDSILKLTQMV